MGRGPDFPDDFRFHMNDLLLFGQLKRLVEPESGDAVACVPPVPCARCKVYFAGGVYFVGKWIPSNAKGGHRRPFAIAPCGMSILLTGLAATPYQPIGTKANRKNRKAGTCDRTWGGMISAVLPVAAALV